jgi:hypothetical protein
VRNDKESLNKGKLAEMAQGTINIENVGGDDFFLTLNDLNGFNSPKVADNRRINSSEVSSFSVELDRNGDAILKWRIVSASPPVESDDGEDTISNGDTVRLHL